MTRTTSSVLFSFLVILVSTAGVRSQDPVPELPRFLDPALTRSAIVGQETTYVVGRGDTLPGLAAWYGIDGSVIAAQNKLQPRAALKPGMSLQIPNRHIVPPGAHDGIVINIPQRHLFYFKGATLAAHYPVAVGRGDWRTPTGGFHIAVKETDPTWEVPKSIQAEMQRKGQRVQTSVPPGPDNPLGQHWLGLNRTGVGIHGTNNPDSIYRSTTHGCVRMHADDVAALFTAVTVKTPVKIIYQPVLFAMAEDGIYVEAHADVYRKGGDTVAAVQKLAEDAGVEDRVDWNLVRETLSKREGIARRVSR